MSDSPDQLRAELQAALQDDYAVERQLGRGGMGAVFLARDLRLDRPVAIKVLPPELAVRPELRERFLRETRTAASFSHPNIVPVHAVGAREHLLYFVMGFVEGESLAERIRRAGPLSGHDATRLLQEVAWALSYAHGRGIVHRDIKPDNILIERATGRALVTDFGIARSNAGSALTSVGDVVGTPQFMSPEQASGDTVDGRSDLYSLGVVGYCAVTGHVPFNADSTPAILAMHITRAAPPVATERPDLPPALSAAIDRCLAKRPEDRFQSGEALAEALDAARQAHVEIAPAIRLFQQKTATLLRNAFIMACFIPLILSRFASDVDKMMGLLTLASAVGALVVLALLALRDLARQGFRYDEIRAGLVAIREERQEAARLARGMPDWRRRRRFRRFVLLGMAIAAVVLFHLGRRYRVPVPGEPGRYQLPLLAVVAFALAFMLGMATIVFAAGTSASTGRMDGWISRLWTGVAGSTLFKVVSRGLASAPHRTPAQSPAAAADARTMFGQLPVEVRRKLKPVGPALDRLDQQVEAARERIATLDRSEQNAQAATGSGAHADRDKLLAELRAARTAAEERLATLLDSRESLRLALVRVESGLGGVEDVLKLASGE
jgi:serine/threonine-protein kinase